ncbi:beta-ketoacyl-[acyl-carrier-protein] synthase family protein [Enterococcus sp. UD-01]|jgi:3-oxoacyl-[acyl-carrier-protein] synthase II|uniref:beta-ketoacyl-[acyl-carrier-protein] synthase family protein n=1 Tax=Enterococcus sp. UD-01 TaxID=3373911 RepID=UPI0038359D4C
MSKKIVVTGLGIINPLGNTIEEFEFGILKEKSAISKITNFDTSNFPFEFAGEVRNFNATNYINRRFIKKTDKFTQFALAATSCAIEDSHLNLQFLETDRIGIYFGNNSGGWNISERGFEELYKFGPTFVNPWQATAWFPAAAQGYISIANSIHGTSKSYVADKATGGVAMFSAINSIKRGDNDIVICGGTEAPLTLLSGICHYEAGELLDKNDEKEGILPFCSKSDGTILGEGSSVLILEEYEHALDRNAPIYAEIKNISTNFGDDSLELNMENCLVQSKLEYKDIDLLLPEANGIVKNDNVENQAISNLNLKYNHQPNLKFPKKYYGHLYGAQASTDVIAAILYLKNADKNSIKTRALINNRSKEGINVSIAIEKID